jgi:hypothetical protein
MSRPEIRSRASVLVALTALALAGVVEGCCFMPTPDPAPTSVSVPAVSVPADPAVAVPTTPAAPAAGGGGGVCGRATDCCNAYVDAIQGAQGNIAAQAMAGSIEQVRQQCGTYASLGGMGPSAEPGCQSAIDGYRTGLGAIGVTVPAACQ